MNRGEVRKVKWAALNKFGNYITERRKQLKLSNYKLSIHARVPSITMYRWESGKSFPEIKYLRRIAKALQVSDLTVRKEMAKAEMFRVLVKYGFITPDDPDRYRIELKRKNRKHEQQKTP